MPKPELDIKLLRAIFKIEKPREKERMKEKMKKQRKDTQVNQMYLNLSAEMGMEPREDPELDYIKEKVEENVETGGRGYLHRRARSPVSACMAHIKNVAQMFIREVQDQDEEIDPED